MFVSITVQTAAIEDSAFEARRRRAELHRFGFQTYVPEVAVGHAPVEQLRCLPTLRSWPRFYSLLLTTYAPKSISC
jgi:hypothetical protein